MELNHTEYEQLSSIDILMSTAKAAGGTLIGEDGLIVMAGTE
jgi:hypothetical protein